MQSGWEGFLHPSVTEVQLSRQRNRIWILNPWFHSAAEGMRLVEMTWGDKFTTPCTSNAFLSFVVYQEDIEEPGAWGGSVPRESAGQPWGVHVCVHVCTCHSLASTWQFVAHCFLCPGSWVRSALPQQMWSLSPLAYPNTQLDNKWNHGKFIVPQVFIHCWF